MKYREAIAETTLQLMKDDPKVIVLGEGVADQKGIFGTTKLAHDAFPDRVIETPLSENMLTGALAGLACEGFKPIYVHARAEFSLLGMEHIVNTIAKWPALHGGQELPIVIRMLVGHGWGQGPTHSQSFHGMFASVPGLEVMYPVFPDAVGPMLWHAVKRGKPTIFIEPRRLYELERVSSKDTGGEAQILTIGDSILDAVAAQKILYPSVGLRVRALQNFPPDILTTKPTVIVDSTPIDYGATAEIMALIDRDQPVIRVGPHSRPCPTAEHLEKDWYPTPLDIANAVLEILGYDNRIETEEDIDVDMKRRVLEPF